MQCGDTKFHEFYQNFCDLSPKIGLIPTMFAKKHGQIFGNYLEIVALMVTALRSEEKENRLLAAS